MKFFAVHYDQKYGDYRIYHIEPPFQHKLYELYDIYPGSNSIGINVVAETPSDALSITQSSFEAYNRAFTTKPQQFWRDELGKVKI